ncbi:predicted protein [Arabidopsis lyrata subsp. lyrata]|uniref:Predicted protein n=1 Tax=Arabidopsis lyrata subsp. lyrata TaxID=81972 RepID=D7LMC4_ARALL|nr:predicted protein [Arabidopsis lyrata subsp. lyrata]
MADEPTSMRCTEEVQKARGIRLHGRSAQARGIQLVKSRVIFPLLLAGLHIKIVWTRPGSQPALCSGLLISENYRQRRRSPVENNPNFHRRRGGDTLEKNESPETRLRKESQENIKKTPTEKKSQRRRRTEASLPEKKTQ